MTHNFRESLDFSHKASDLPIWKEIYEKAFPGCIMVDHRQDGYHQRAGIDRSLILPSSKQILVDEKVRGRNKKTGKVYTDIALEFISNDRTGAPGWVCKPLAADYIAYAIAPLGKAYLLPVLDLQAAWRSCGECWRQKYFIVKALNNGYTTHSVGVPPKEIFREIVRVHCVIFSPINLLGDMA